MFQLAINFVLSILAGIVANCICKWLVDRHDKKHKRQTSPVTARSSRNPLTDDAVRGFRSLIFGERFVSAYSFAIIIPRR